MSSIPNEPRGLQIEQFEGDLMTVNMGPQHPSTHGVLRLLLKTDGEVVHEAQPHIGYLHRCFEKHAEAIDYPGVIPFCDRMDYVASMANSMGYALAVESMMGLEVNDKVSAIRILFAELQRIASHLLAVGTYGIDLGAFTPFLFCFRDREKILDMFEWTCGARLLYNYSWVGGVSHDLPEGFVDRCRAFLDYFEPMVHEYNDLLSFNKIFLERTIEVGILPPELAVAYGVTGPNLRGSGVAWDTRKNEPYLGYQDYDFDVIVGTGEQGTLGSCWDRYMVRVREMWESVKIARQALDRYIEHADQDIHGDLPKRVKVPAGEVFHRTETPRGELGFFIVSDGTGNPYRVKVKSPCFTALSVLPEMAPGNMLADIVAIIGSIDIVLGEVDR